MSLMRYIPGTPWLEYHAHMSRPLWDDAVYRRPTWAYDPYSGRCCEFCEKWHSIPDIAETVSEISVWEPYRHAELEQMYDGIHNYYMLGYDREGPESYYLSKEVEKFLREVQRLSRRSPWVERGLRDFERQLKYLNREVQMGARRRRYGPGAWPKSSSSRYGDYWGW